MCLALDDDGGGEPSVHLTFALEVEAELTMGAMLRDMFGGAAGEALEAAERGERLPNGASEHVAEHRAHRQLRLDLEREREVHRRLGSVVVVKRRALVDEAARHVEHVACS